MSEEEDDDVTVTITSSSMKKVHSLFTTVLSLFRADKEKLEQKCANLQESLAHNRRELSKAKEQMQSLEAERCKAKERADTLEQVNVCG